MNNEEIIILIDKILDHKFIAVYCILDTLLDFYAYSPINLYQNIVTSLYGDILSGNGEMDKKFESLIYEKYGKNFCELLSELIDFVNQNRIDLVRDLISPINLEIKEFDNCYESNNEYCDNYYIYIKSKNKELKKYANDIRRMEKILYYKIQEITTLKKELNEEKQKLVIQKRLTEQKERDICTCVIL